MTDKLSPAERSANMAKIKAKNTQPELRVRRFLHRLGYRFRLHSPRLPGRPDLVLPKHRLAIFVHGCFWHRHEGCRRTTTPAVRPEFWNEKFRRTIVRDKDVAASLAAAGWSVLVIWECETKNEASIRTRLESVLRGVRTGSSGELRSAR